MNYGLPYKGSKNKLAERIVDLFPKAENFYDLFCGGCAITHRVLMTNKFDNVVINDINKDCTDLFLDAIHGKFKNEKRWISREEFKESKEPYVKFCWSFGNNLKGYLYSKEIEPLKRAWHYALYFNDYKPFKEFGVDLSCLDDEKNFKQKYWKSKKIIHEASIFNTGRSHLELQSLESLERLESLESLESLERLQSLERFNKSYDEIEIKENSVIYCDIPYFGTDKYLTDFDFEKFYSWCGKQKELTFISSYQMPLNFIPVASFDHRSILSASVNKKVEEKIFIPEHQIKLYESKKNFIQFDLFKIGA